ncbi:MAG: DUF5655 domain-containing protein [Thermomicrobiales bacterium]
MTPVEFFSDQPLAEQLYAAVRGAVGNIGPVDIRATKSQVAFRRQRTFAAVWRPSQYLAGTTAPLVLTIFLPRHIASPRWKQVVEPAPGRFTHHLELHNAAEVDEEVRSWLRAAWDAA